MKKYILILLGILLLLKMDAQQWGLYTLYAPKSSNKAYLIDTNDTPATYKTWTFETSKKTAYSTYMIFGDTIVRSYSINNSVFNGGGTSGGVQKVDWNNNVTWDFTHSSTTYCLHHEICPMPNGNVLMISYELKTAAQLTQAGSSTSLTTGIWSEKLIEVQPTGPTTGDIVWEWHLWDHLCQNNNATKDNYVTSIPDNKHLMNLNYKTTKDWWHMNGIDYNEELDLIAISSHNMNEVYIIDHSTTTAQAAGHSGGRCGKGGDFLYRWGNPAAYGLTGTTNFNVVHDAHFVPSDNPNYPSYFCAYNN
ncbi:MAG: hypothetical protein EOM76_09765, partial [Sphingobacteriia bacterium]|nr:hypothetical protein [Sphingobacteriia bacterium]